MSGRERLNWFLLCMNLVVLHTLVVNSALFFPDPLRRQSIEIVVLTMIHVSNKLGADRLNC